MSEGLVYLILVLNILTIGADGQVMPPVHLRGFVLDAKSGIPIDGATVNVVGGEAKQTAVTDINGLFILTLRNGARPGDSVRLRIEKSGYKTYDVTTPVTEDIPFQARISPVPKIASKSSHRVPTVPSQAPAVNPSGPRNPQPNNIVQNGETKTFTAKKPRDLLALFANQTTFQGDLAITPFKGLWTKAEGEVTTVVDAGGGGVEVMLNDGGDSISCRFERPWRAALTNLSLKKTIDVQGKISQAQNGTTLYLTDCELLAVPSIGGLQGNADQTQASAASRISSPGPTISVVDESGRPLIGVEFLVVRKDGTHLSKVTSDEHGKARLEEEVQDPVTLFAAGRQLRYYLEANCRVGQGFELQMRPNPAGGSVIIPDGTGYIDGLDGRLNPILDSSSRTYLYAENIAIEDGKVQPVIFQIKQPLRLRDRHGNSFEIEIESIIGSSSLMNYVKLQK